MARPSLWSGLKVLLAEAEAGIEMTSATSAARWATGHGIAQMMAVSATGGLHRMTVAGAVHEIEEETGGGAQIARAGTIGEGVGGAGVAPTASLRATTTTDHGAGRKNHSLSC